MSRSPRPRVWRCPRSAAIGWRRNSDPFAPSVRLAGLQLAGAATLDATLARRGGRLVEAEVGAARDLAGALADAEGQVVRVLVGGAAELGARHGAHQVLGAGRGVGAGRADAARAVGAAAARLRRARA